MPVLSAAAAEVSWLDYADRVRRSFSRRSHSCVMRNLIGSSAAALALLLAFTGATPTADTQYAGNITQSIDTGSAHVGDPVTLNNVVSEDGAVNGATLSGHVSHVVPAGSGRAAQLEIVFTTLTLGDGTKYAVDGIVTGMQAKTKSNAAREIFGAVAGMVAGNIIAKSVFGATTGAGGFLGASGGYLIAKNMRQNMTVPQGSAVRVTLRSIRRQATQP